MAKTSQASSRSRDARVDVIARTVTRRRSLQDLDQLARAVGYLVPAVRAYRETRAIAVTGSHEGLEDFASFATRRRCDATQVWLALDAYRAGERSAEVTEVLARMVPSRAEGLAWLLLQLHRDDIYLERAAALLAWLSRPGGSQLSTSAQSTLVEVHLLLGDTATAARHVGRVDPDLRWRAMTDLANPGIGGGDVSDWLERLNAPLVAEGFEPVRVESDAPDAYHGLVADAPAGPDPVRVTVVVSAWRPSSTLLVAVRSVLSSSWPNLEVLVVDDASGESYRPLFDAVAHLDDRVRVHTMEANGGTYAIRNWALNHATGDLITFHDSDDWMHPQRIATQATWLIDHRKESACLTASLRVTPAMALVNSRSLGVKLCEPSIMFWRQRVVEKIGGFDRVRKGGDAEYRHRLETDTGHSVPIIAKAPLTFQLVDEDSLSGTDIRRYSVSLSRRIYRGCYEQWHARHRRSAKGLTRPVDSRVRGAYAPPGIADEPATPAVDTVVVADLLDARRSSAVRRALRIARGRADAGHVTGFMHQPGPWHLGRMSVNVSRRLITLLNSGSAVMVDSAQEVT